VAVKGHAVPRQLVLHGSTTDSLPALPPEFISTYRGRALCLPPDTSPHRPPAGTRDGPPGLNALTGVLAGAEHSRPCQPGYLCPQSLLAMACCSSHLGICASRSRVATWQGTLDGNDLKSRFL
jgi:hypothetical protein